MKQLTAHIISHSHWDREWYMPFERHRVRLIELLDQLLDLADCDPDFQSFHLDGQTIILEDYLQIRPERKEALLRLVQAGKLHIGPWYILQDEFLTSSEANIRNLLIGHRDAREYGAVCKVGYFPDSFGNMGQAPQILKQAGMDNAVFGRGVKPVGFNNEVAGNYESSYSEMIWRSPDGSEVLGILFANWYHNGMEIPVDAESSERYWRDRLAAAKQYASTPHLLFMNGCDHQPLQTDLTAAIRTAQQVMPDVQFVHSSFPAYIGELKKALPSDLSTIHGELRSQRTDGWFTLVNTASARVYIKQANQRTQTLLEKVAEPLAAFAYRYGSAYPHHLLDYAWRTLMQNHPHDSICGCSVDEVHQEMMVRFAKSGQVAEEMIGESLAYLTARMDTAAVFGRYEDARPFAVFNTSGWDRSGVLSVELELQRISLDRYDREEAVRQLKSLPIQGLRVIDEHGAELEAQLEDLGIGFGYTLPKDRFRQPYLARKVRVTLLAEQVPASGYRTYALLPSEDGYSEVAASVAVEQAAGQVLDAAPSEAQSPSPVTHRMDNAYLTVDIQDDGSLHMTDKRNGRHYEDLHVFENVGDIGNEYIFRQPDGDEAITTKGKPADIRLVERSGRRTVYEIRYALIVPASADEKLDEEIREFVPFLERRAGRGQEHVELQIRSVLTLERGAAKLQIRTSLNNQAKDHRLRVLFPTDTATEIHRADSVFEVAIRDNVPAPEWINPSNCQHQQAFVNVSDDDGGLTVANHGLNEYEVLRDGRNTIALTLLRSVGEVGDWGVFPTPEAQCLGEHVLEYAVLPHTDDSGRLQTFAAAYQEQVPWVTRQLELTEGELPASFSFLDWSGPGLALSAVKVSEPGGEAVFRWFNMTAENVALTVSADGVTGWYRSNVLEERGERIGEDGLTVKPYEIVTIGAEL
ncbi:alpha-mannosidase [Paenibacillus filicis]|uniref:Alpha-mannosidase n=1 Tax=Paenibacillus filicis TaxID=669464 RepID=A0ABU9DIT4_9BACL